MSLVVGVMSIVVLVVFVLLGYRSTFGGGSALVVDESTDRWLTYKQNEFGYSFRYPGIFEVSKTLENDQGDIVSLVKEATQEDRDLVKIEVAASRIPVKDYLEKVEGNNKYMSEFVQVKGSNPKMFRAKSNSEFMAESMITGSDKMSYQLTVMVFGGDEQRYFDVFDKIVSTFRYK